MVQGGAGCRSATGSVVVDAHDLGVRVAWLCTHILAASLRVLMLRWKCSARATTALCQCRVGLATRVHPRLLGLCSCKHCRTASQQARAAGHACT